MKTASIWRMAPIAVMLILSEGCHTVIPNQEFKAPSLSIVCVDAANMGKLLAKRIPYDPLAPYCNAYIDVQKRVLYVPWSKEVDISGHPLPDFNALGHELWHAIAGWWHGGTVFLSSKTETSPSFPLGNP
jgi:hypothetical protein